LRAMNLQVDMHPGETVDARITASRLRYGATVLADFAVRGRFMPGEVTVDDLSFGLAGGRALVSAQAQTARAGTQLRLVAALSGADTGQVGRLFGAATGQISGRLDARAEVEMTGETVDAALKDSRAQAILSVLQGQVTRDLLEQLSTDLRAQFRSREGSVQLTCLLAAMEMRNGIGTVAPLRLRTPGTAVIGGGKINFVTSRVDLRVQSLPGTTGLFALDIPLEITGTFDRPSVRMAIGSSADIRALDRMPALSADLRQISDRSPCGR